MRAIPLVLTFLFYLVFNLVSIPVDMIIRLFQALSGDEAED